MVNINAPHRGYFWLSLIATILAFCVILLGAHTRLKGAGLGCPDWPGCYGQITVPHTATELKKAVQLFPGSTVQTAKAWTEMVHRYFAGSLGLLIFALTIFALIHRRHDPKQPIAVPLILTAIVIFQALLGMWTVTWKLLPLVVMTHLLGGMTITALLWWLTLKTGNLFAYKHLNLRQVRPWAILGILIVAIQIFLGGWTSVNYASLTCAHFPLCQGSLFPHMEWKRAFNFLSPIGANYQGGVLDMAARVTIQMAHRYWAFVVLIYIGILSLYLIIRSSASYLHSLGWVILVLLIMQIILGILNVELLLPMSVALAHDGVAALLLLSLVTLIYMLYSLRGLPREFTQL